MDLRLYKEPYIDPAYPGIARLLFEGRVPEEHNPDDADFYLYVWIQNDGYLHGFQAVLGERVALGYQAPSRKSFGRLGRDIIDRGITQKETPEDREMLLSKIRDMENEHFPALIGYIKKLASSEAVEGYRLVARERVLFISLKIKS